MNNIEDLENLTPFLKELGQTHMKVGVMKHHYPIFIDALLGTFEKILQNEFTDEVRHAWTLAGNLLQESMISDNYATNQNGNGSQDNSQENEIEIGNHPHGANPGDVSGSELSSMRLDESIRPLNEHKELDS